MSVTDISLLGAELLRWKVLRGVIFCCSHPHKHSQPNPDVSRTPCLLDARGAGALPLLSGGRCGQGWRPASAPLIPSLPLIKPLWAAASPSVRHDSALPLPWRPRVSSGFTRADVSVRAWWATLLRRLPLARPLTPANKNSSVTFGRRIRS